MRPVRVLIVEDSMLFRQLLVQNLGTDPMIDIVAVANDPFDARDAIIETKPDVMTLDVELPRMNGIEFLRKLMPQYPLPVVVISALNDKVFDAMNAGAVEFVAKPQVTDRSQLEYFVKKELVSKIKIAAKANVGRAIHPDMSQTPVAGRVPVAGGEKLHAKDRVLAIGASTGGTEAIAEVIKSFRPDIPGTVIVQHMPPGFTEMYAKRLNNQCQVTVKEAKTGDKLMQGHVLIAPGGDSHMHLVKVNGEYQVVIKKGPKVNGHCPSVDVLFNSVAEIAGNKAVGVILTGMGGDGAKGLLAMRRAGARTVGQDESTCVVYGMPKVAYDLGAVQFQEKLQNIAGRVYQLMK